MKIIFLLIILHAAVYGASAQKKDPANFSKQERVNSIKDKQVYRGYMIKLKPGGMDSYQFDISTDNKPMVHRFDNPLPFSPRGIRKKQDAYKIAQWFIDDYIKTGHWQNMVPPHIVRQLEIESDL